MAARTRSKKAPSQASSTTGKMIQAEAKADVAKEKRAARPSKTHVSEPPLEVTTRKLASPALAFIATVLFFWVLYVGKDILVPFVLALFCWYLINAIARGLTRFLPRRPRLRLAISTLAFFAFLSVPVQLVSYNADEIIQNAPLYQENLSHKLQIILGYFGLSVRPLVEQLSSMINAGTLAKQLTATLTGIAGSSVMILLYLAFMLAEQSSFRRKLLNMLPDQMEHQRAENLLNNIGKRVQDYLWVKTVLSLATAGISWAIMLAVGLNFAAFWAILIFFLNFIPNIGAVAATLFPLALAMAQFDSLTPVIILAAGMGSAQFIVGNILEPYYMGDSLNLSPLAIMLTLVLWGSLWGMTGMYLSVPITVIVAIICAEFPQTRSIAVLLSEKGHIHHRTRRPRKDA